MVHGCGLSADRHLLFRHRVSMGEAAGALGSGWLRLRAEAMNVPGQVVHRVENMCPEKHNKITVIRS